MRKDQEMYKRNRGECSHCHRTIGPFTIVPQGIYNSTLCHACLIKAVLVAEAPTPKKKKVIQSGLDDTEAGRTPTVEL